MTHDAESEVILPTRSKELADLLNALTKEDALFEYNVPSTIRTNYDDDSLERYLEIVYTKPRFIIDEAKEIAKYLTIGDKVVKVGEFKKVNYELKSNSVGTYEGVNSKNSQEGVVYFNCNLRLSIALNDLKFVERSQGWLSKPLTYSDLVGTGHERVFQVKDKVRYTGKEIVKYHHIIPDGAEGLVVNVINSNNKAHLHIIWHNQPGLEQKSEWYTDTWAIKPHVWFNYSDVKLVRTNYVDFEKLYNAHVGKKD